jgi:hypothetical protein
MTREEFENIAKRTHEFFNNSYIKKEAETKGYKWFYSISATKIVKNNPLIIGLNWGAKSGDDYSEQKEMPTDIFFDLYNNKSLGSFQRIWKYVEEYLPEYKENIGMSNYFFLRSKDESQILKDLEQWNESKIFDDFLYSAQPTHLICFGKSVKNYFLERNLVSDIIKTDIIYNSKKFKHTAVKGKYTSLNVDVNFLPHPNSQFSLDALKNIWEFHFGNLR